MSKRSWISWATIGVFLAIALKERRKKRGQLADETVTRVDPAGTEDKKKLAAVTPLRP